MSFLATSKMRFRFLPSWDGCSACGFVYVAIWGRLDLGTDLGEEFNVRVNGVQQPWPGIVALEALSLRGFKALAF